MIFVEKTARVSACGNYRTHLARRSPLDGTAIFIMLNPSTADDMTDDPTIRRCMGFAQALRLGGVSVVNLFTRRATDPKALLACEDPVGPDARQAIDDAITNATSEARARQLSKSLGHAVVPDRIICAWGAAPERPDWFRIMHQEQVDFVRDTARQMAHELWCFGITKDGSPRHPLYVKACEPLVRWPQ
jgi:hypothetical protein